MTASKSRAFWPAFLIVLLGLTLAIGGTRRVDGPELDPRSTGPLGTKALVQLLESMGGDVEITSEVPRSSRSVVLVLRDTLEPGQREDLEALVGRGARLVVADPASSLGAPSSGATSLFGPLDDETIQPDHCNIGELSGVDELAPGSTRLVAVGGDSQSCFGSRSQAFVVIRAQGRGQLVTIGGAGVLTNSRLGDSGNSVLAAELLVPDPGADVYILDPVQALGDGSRSAMDIAREDIGPGLPYSILLAVLAFVVYVAFRARRLGRPISEPQAVQIAGSEFVIASGRLRRGSGDPAAAARILRSQLRRDLAERVGVPTGYDLGLLSDAVSALTTIERDEVYGALSDQSVGSNAELMDLIARVDSIRQEVLNSVRVSTTTD